MRSEVVPLPSIAFVPRTDSASSTSTVHGLTFSASGLSTPVTTSPQTPGANPSSPHIPDDRLSPTRSTLLPQEMTMDGGDENVVLGRVPSPKAQPWSIATQPRDLTGSKESPRTSPDTSPRLRHKPDMEGLRKYSATSSALPTHGTPLCATAAPEFSESFEGADLATGLATMGVAPIDLAPAVKTPARVDGGSDPAVPAIQYTPDTPTTNRLSSSSSTPTVVHASIVFRPPPQSPTLRKVSKTESLRSDVSKRSNRSSLNSELTASPFSSPSRSNDRHKRYSQESDTSSSIDMPQMLRRKRDQSQLRRSLSPDIEREVGQEHLQRWDPVAIAGQHSETRNSPFPRAFPSNSPLLPVPTLADMWTLAPHDDIGDTGSHPTPPTVHTMEMLPAPKNVESPVSSSDVFHDAASHVSRQTSVKTLDMHNNLAVGMPEQSSSHMEFETSDEDLRGLNHSFGRSEFVRQLPLNFSPMSVKSDATLAFEVREASAVNIFAHNNESVVVVHHSGSGDLLRQHNPSRTTGSSMGGLGLSMDSRDCITDSSPLQNPREAPAPPIVAVIPPTPARELDNLDEQEGVKATADSPSKPYRQPSLLQRARRYSDTVLQPLTGSLRRQRHTRPRPNTGVTSAHHPHPGVSTQEGSNLHPFWRPRGFWNDLSDSEDSDEEDGEEVWRLTTPSRMEPPPSSLRSRPTWIRGASLRGFLIGNSLGLERGPTNRRRPVIILPSRGTTVGGPIVTVRDSARHSARESRRYEKKNESISDLFRAWRSALKERRASRRYEEALALEERRSNLRQTIGQPRHVSGEPDINWAQRSVPDRGND